MWGKLNPNGRKLRTRKNERKQGLYGWPDLLNKPPLRVIFIVAAFQNNHQKWVYAATKFNKRKKAAISGAGEGMYLAIVYDGKTGYTGKILVEECGIISCSADLQI